MKSLAGGCIGHELDGCRVCYFKSVRGSRGICHELDFAWVIIGVVVGVETHNDVGYVGKVVRCVTYEDLVSVCCEEYDDAPSSTRLPQPVAPARCEGL